MSARLQELGELHPLRHVAGVQEIVGRWPATRGGTHVGRGLLEALDYPFVDDLLLVVFRFADRCVERLDERYRAPQISDYLERPTVEQFRDAAEVDVRFTRRVLDHLVSFVRRSRIEVVPCGRG